jgi:hypothetical protein
MEKLSQNEYGQTLHTPDGEEKMTILWVVRPHSSPQTNQRLIPTLDETQRERPKDGKPSFV